MWSRVESTSRVSLGVRPGHIGFSGESWSMLPGSWLTRGIGYKPTRPADWFILSATPAYTVLSRNYFICLPPSRYIGSLLLFPSLYLSLLFLSDPSLFYPSAVLFCAFCPYFSHRTALSIICPSFIALFLTRVSFVPDSTLFAFDLRRKKIVWTRL